MVMHRSLPTSLLAGLMIAWAGRADGQTFTPRTYEAREAAAPIVLDGKLDDAAWGAADTIQNFYLYNSGGLAAPQTTSLRLAWDANYVYGGFRILDTDIRSAALGHDGDLYLGDNAELFLSPTGAAPYYEFEFSPNGDTFDALFATRGASTPDSLSYESGLKAAITIDGTDRNNSDTDTGWTLEFAIPRASLASFAPGDVWTFLGSRYDYPAVGDPTLILSSPGPTPSGFHTYEIYDRLVFTPLDVTEPVPEPSTTVLLASGLVALAVGARARRRASR